MNAIITPPPILPVNVDGIPASMMEAARWAPWRAVIALIGADVLFWISTASAAL